MGAHRITEAARLASTYSPEGNAKVMEMVAQLHDGIDLGDERKVLEALFLCNRTGEEITTYLDRVIEEARAMRQARQTLVGFVADSVRDATAASLVVLAAFMACLGFSGHAHAAAYVERADSSAGSWIIAGVVLFIIAFLIFVSLYRSAKPENMPSRDDDWMTQ